MPSPGASARAAGVKWERECVKLARAYGWAEARRGMQFRQGMMAPTTVSDVEGTGLWWECARSRHARLDAALSLLERKAEQAARDLRSVGLDATPRMIAVSAGRCGAIQFFGTDASKSWEAIGSRFGDRFLVWGDLIVVERGWPSFDKLMKSLATCYRGDLTIPPGRASSPSAA